MSLHQLKQEMCEIGRRVYNKGFAAANDGNISYRIGENEVLCSPTMISKGFMKPDDLCIVDMEGKQISGKRKRSSEILLHLTIMKSRPDVKSVVHCHPPHATAFAVAREPIPQCVLPEVEVFLGDIPLTRYETPGSQKFADTVLPFVMKTNCMILTQHGTVSYGETLERAYWWTEILDAYCRILLLAKGLGQIHYFSQQETRELLDLKSKLGFPDARLTPDYQNCDICANDIFRSSWKETGVERKAFDAPPPMPAARAAATTGPSSPVPVLKSPASTGSTGPSAPAPTAASAPLDQEALIQTITDRVLAALGGRA